MAKELWGQSLKDKFKNLEQLRKLYDGEHEAYFVLPTGETRQFDYVTINWLGDTVTRTWRNFTWRKFPRITYKANKNFLKWLYKLDLPTLVLPADTRKSYAGQAVIKWFYSSIAKKPSAIVWGAKVGEYVDFDYLENDRTMPYAVNYWYVRKYFKAGQNEDNTSTPKGEVVVCERHELLFNDSLDVVGTLITNKAYKSVNSIPTDQEEDLAIVFPEERNRPLPEEQTDLKFLPVVIVNNLDRNGDGEGDTDYTPTLISLQKNLNKLVCSRQIVIDLSEHPQILVPPEYLDENGNIDWKRVRIRINYEGEEGAEIKIVGWTGNLENSKDQWKLYREELSALTGLAPIILGELDSEARSGVARRLGLVATESELMARRHQWDKGLRQCIIIANELERAYGQGSVGEIEESEIEIGWPQILPMDNAEMTSMIIQEYQVGLRTLRSAIDLLPMNEDMAPEDKEQEFIELEKKEKESRNLIPPPQNDGVV